MNLIVSVDRNWGIGRGDQLLARVPEDMRRFRRLTLGKTVIVGRRTLASFPQGKPLPDRAHLILSSDPSFAAQGCVVCRSVEEVLGHIADKATDDVWVIGGQSVYEQFLPFCDTAYLTRFDALFDADRFFPALDQRKEWQLKEKSEPACHGELRYWYETYARVSL